MSFGTGRVGGASPRSCRLPYSCYRRMCRSQVPHPRLERHMPRAFLQWCAVPGLAPRTRAPERLVASGPPSGLRQTASREYRRLPQTYDLVFRWLRVGHQRVRGSGAVASREYRRRSAAADAHKLLNWSRSQRRTAANSCGQWSGPRSQRRTAAHFTARISTGRES